MNETAEALSVREMAASLGLRLGTCYGLLWNGLVSARKDENGEWRIDRESVERYRLRRTLHRVGPRTALQRRTIDLSVDARTESKTVTANEIVRSTIV